MAKLPIKLTREGPAQDHNIIRGIKLVEHAMKILERVIERRVRNVVKIDSMQFGFMAGKKHNRCNFHCSPATGEISGKE